MPPFISVLTPTYDREGTLPRLYDSLTAQTFKGFEWIVIDDGSTDSTPELIGSWGDRASFRIVYRRQENQGKHAAVNRGVELAEGQFCAIMDSDDWYSPEALGRMKESWESIPKYLRPRFANVEGLCATPDGSVIGTRFPRHVLDSNTFELRVKHGVVGDKVGMYRRDLLLAHPFPEDLGWHVTPALVWNRIAATYDSRFVDETWGYKEYLPGGLTGRETELRLRYAEAQLRYWTEYAAMPRPMPVRERFRANANVVRYGLVLRRSPAVLLSDSSDRRWTVLAAPVGLALYGLDQLRLRRLSAEAG